MKGIWIRLEFTGAWIFLSAARLLPEKIALALGAAMGSLLYYSVGSRRIVGLKNLALAFPELSGVERRRILLAAYKNHGKMVTELARLTGMTDEQIRRRVSYTPGSRERFEENARRGKGVLFITGHIGNWELLALAHSLHGYTMRIVARRLDNPFIEARLDSLRARGGNKVSERGKGGRRIRDMVYHLRSGGSVGILVDQYARRANGILVPFFGKLASSHRGPAVLALRTGAALLPSFLRRHPGKPGHYLIHFDPAIAIAPTGDSDRDVVLHTARIQEVLEQEIRSRPADWFWVHCRWKNSPDLPDYYGKQLKKWRRHRRSAAAVKTEIT